MRLFTVAVTRTQHRLYLIGSRNLIIDAAPGTALAAIAALGTTVRTVPARLLLGLPPDPRDTRRQTSLGAVGQDLADILAQHVRITAIQDERQFYETFAGYLQSAQHSLWIWAAWTANRLTKVFPAIADAASRGVKTVVFVRDPSDQTQGTPASQQHVTTLRTVVPTVVEVFKLHQKIIVIDERIVLFGSLNALSQSNSREVMLVMEGEHFARKLLDHEQARAIAVPPRCGACGSTTLVLHRTVRQDWFWRCYAPTGAIGPKGRPARCRQETPLKPDRGTRR
jgi:phosphatidylserine/phosphatidylglycerophosphate/cardiolipin synthase-like enzyme